MLPSSQRKTRDINHHTATILHLDFSTCRKPAMMMLHRWWQQSRPCAAKSIIIPGKKKHLLFTVKLIKSAFKLCVVMMTAILNICWTVSTLRSQTQTTFTEEDSATYNIRGLSGSLSGLPLLPVFRSIWKESVLLLRNASQREADVLSSTSAIW